MTPGVNVRILRTMYRWLRREDGAAAADAFLAGLGLDAAFLADENRWIDYPLYARAWRTLRDHAGDPAIGFKVGRFTMSRDNLGSLWPVLRAAGLLGGGTAAAYRIVPRITNQLSRLGRFTLDAAERTSVRMRWQQASGVPFDPVQCQYRQGLLAAGPCLADLPLATVTEDACLGRGDDACRYHVQFTAERAVGGRRVGAVVGGGAALAALAFGAGWPIAALLLVTAVALGLARDRADQLAFNTATLADQVEQLLEAKLRLQADYELLRQTQAELRDKERLAGLGELSARVAHELRNPLGIVKAAARRLADPGTTPAVRDEMLQYVCEEVDRMSAALSSVLVFARPRAPDRRPIAVPALVERLLLEWELRDAPGVRVGVALPTDLPAVLADPDHLRQALLNLLLNAGEATEGSGAVRLSATAADGRVRLAVDDDGPGFAADAQARAFEPFFTTKRNGTGLGLTNVRQMMEANGGRVVVEPRPRGARVVLELEAAARTSAAAHEPQEARK